MRTMKKILAAGLTAVMAMSLMVGCGSKKDDSSSKTYNLGIIQFAEHGSLDNCRKGFLKGLESEGIKEGIPPCRRMACGSMSLHAGARR